MHFSPRAALAAVFGAGLIACSPLPNSLDDGGSGGCETKLPNLLTNGGFECGGATPTGWTQSYGTMTREATAGRNGTAAAKVVADALGGRLAVEIPTDRARRLYCAAAYVKGQATESRNIYMRIWLTGDGANPSGQFAAPIDPDWARVPPTISVSAEMETSSLQLMFEIQTARTDEFNAKPGDMMLVDDVEVWSVAPTSKCADR